MEASSRLNALRVVNPCEVPWASMDGDDRVRFCDRCRKNVYNVAAMLPREALTLIRRNEGRVCVQLMRRRDGTLVAGDCWARLRRARRKGLLTLVVTLPVVLAAQVGVQLFGLQMLGDFLRDAPKRELTEAQGLIRGGGVLIYK